MTELYLRKKRTGRQVVPPASSAAHLADVPRRNTCAHAVLQTNVQAALIKVKCMEPVAGRAECQWTVHLS